MDLQKIITQFRVFTRGEKKTVSLQILSKSVSYGGIFEELWQSIQDDTISDQDLDNIYESAMRILSDVKSEKSATALQKIHVSRNYLGSIKQKEEQERNVEKGKHMGNQEYFFNF